MDVCRVQHDGAIMLHRPMQAAPDLLLTAIAPDGAGLVVAVEGLFTWSWRAALWAHEGSACVLGQARSRTALHGGKATHATSDAPTIAVLLRGGLRPQASVSPAPRCATRALGRRRTHLRRNRAALLAHVQPTTRHYHVPERGTKIASQAPRDGVAARCAAPAVPKSLEGDLALRTSDDPRLGDVALAIAQAAQPHDAPTRALGQTVPGIGTLLRRGRLDARHDLDRLPTVQDCVSSGRLVKGAQASAGQRVGTSGKKLGHAPRTWALSAAAAWCLRTHPAGQNSLARVETKHDQGTAWPILAPTRARAVSDRRPRHPALALDQVRQSEGSSVGAPAASRDTQGCAGSARTSRPGSLRL